MKRTQRDQLYHNLLDDDRFFQWILHPSPELDEYWATIMHEDKEKKEVIVNLKTIINGFKVVEEDLSAEDTNDMWDIIEKSKPKKNRRFHLISIVRYAAVMLILIASSVFLYTTFTYTSDHSINYELLISSPLPTDESTDNVLIMLANKDKIEVKENSVELIHDKDGKISVNSKIVEQKTTPDKPENDLNQIYVPFGKTTSIVMSDGTKIWVNSGSRLIYPSVFAGNKREIYVDGEIYLEVSKNEKIPFIVRTDLLEINVLGTSFNVSAYRNDENQSVVLATGSVSVTQTNQKIPATIKPNQKYTIEKSTKSHSLEEVNVFDYICWKYGFFVFENEKLSNVLTRIRRYYNRPIIYDLSETDHITVSGKLDLKENIEETFRIVSITTPIRYIIQEKDIKISVKPKK